MKTEFMREDIKIENIINMIRTDIDAKKLSVKDQYLLTPYYKKCIDEYSSYDEIILVGAGDYGRRLYEMFVLEYIEKSVVAFADNSKLRQGVTWNGMTCLSMEEAIKEYPDANYIITPKDYEMELFQQLIGLGIMPCKITIFNFANSGLLE